MRQRLISCSGTMGKVAIIPTDFRKGIINQALLKVTSCKDKLNNKYLKFMLLSDMIQNRHFKDQLGSSIQNVASVKNLKQITIPLPSLDIQKEIVAEIEEEKKHIESCKKLIDINGNKTKETIEQIWGEGEE